MFVNVAVNSLIQKPALEFESLRNSFTLFLIIHLDFEFCLHRRLCVYSIHYVWHGPSFLKLVDIIAVVEVVVDNSQRQLLFNFLMICRNVQGR